MSIRRFQSVHRALLVMAVGALAALPAVAPAATESVIFTIDPTQSAFGYAGSNNVYGAYVPQSPGSDTSTVSGHFLVSFDPLTNTPTSIQLVGGDGYYQEDTPLAMMTSTPGVVFDHRDLSWDFSSPVLNGSGGVFTATTTNFNVLSGTVNGTLSDGETGSNNIVPYNDHVTAGTWTLSQSPAGSGNWTLGVSGYYATSIDWPSPYGSGPETFSLNAISTAHFGAANVATVAPTDNQASALGGSTTPGGVSINFGSPTNGGTFTAQQIPNATSLSQQAITAAQNNPIFAASTGDLSVNPQIWSVDYTGLQTGQSATLVFHYDPSLLPAGTDQSTLGIWHFDKMANAWVFGGTVDTTDHTISFTTSSFSPFELGVKATPEPATIVLLGLGMAALAAARLRRRHP